MTSLRSFDPQSLDLDIYIQNVQGLGRGKGFKNTYEPKPVKGSLVDFWINRLEEVISYLKKNQKKKTSLVLTPSKRNSNLVLETSASQKMVLRSTSTPKLILSAKNSSLGQSTKAKR